MKQEELLKHSTCSLCNRKVLSGGLPLFWRVTIERFGVDLAECRRQDGFAAYLGNTVLARVMGEDPDLTVALGPPVTITVCEGCAVDTRYCVAGMSEAGGRSAASVTPFTNAATQSVQPAAERIDGPVQVFEGKPR